MIEILINLTICLVTILVVYLIVEKHNRTSENMYEKLAGALEDILDFAVNGIRPPKVVDLQPFPPTEGAELTEEKEPEKEEKEEEKLEVYTGPEKIKPEEITLETLRGITFGRKLLDDVSVFPVLRDGFPIPMVLPGVLVGALNKHFGYDKAGGYESLVTNQDFDALLKSFDIKFLKPDEDSSLEYIRYMKKFKPNEPLTEEEKKDITNNAAIQHGRMQFFAENQKNRVTKFIPEMEVKGMGLKFEDGNLVPETYEVKPKIETYEAPKVPDIFQASDPLPIKKVLRYIGADNSIVEKVTFSEELYQLYQRDWGMDIGNQFYLSPKNLMPTEEQFIKWKDEIIEKKRQEFFILFDE